MKIAKILGAMMVASLFLAACANQNGPAQAVAPASKAVSHSNTYSSKLGDTSTQDDVDK